MNRVPFWLFTVLTLIAALSTAFFYMKVRERDAVLDRFIAESTRGTAPSDTDAVVMALSRAIFSRTNRGIPASRLPFYERLESTSFFNVTSAVSLEYGAYGVIGHSTFGPCGTMTRTLLVSLWRLRIPAHKLQLLDDPDSLTIGTHTMVEYRSDGRWQVISTSDSSFVWRNRDGLPATVEEIRGDPAIFAQILALFPDYPARFDRTSHIRWEKLPRAVRLTFRTILGDEAYENAYTPSLYDQPRHLLLFVSLTALVSFGVLATVARRLGRQRAA